MNSHPDAAAERTPAIQDYYRRAMWAPPVVGMVALGAASLLNGILSESIWGLLWWLGVTGVVASIPYGIYVLIMQLAWPPQTEREYRRAVFMAPIGSGLILATPTLAFVLLEGSGTGGWRDAVKAFSWLSNAALAVGVAFVAFVEAGAWLWKRQHRAPIDTPTAEVSIP